LLIVEVSNPHFLTAVFLRYWLPVIVWMVVIFGASGDARSVQHSDGLLSRLFAWLHIQVTREQLESLRWFVRKGAHMTEYAVLALLWWRALRGRAHAVGWSGRAAAQVLLICILYAASDEFHQSFVKNRSASVVDVLIDGTGATLALLLVWLATKRRSAKAA
jgi:VanZ family protein